MVYPENSDNETSEYMKAIGFRQSWHQTVLFEPVLSILDLTKEKYFTYSDAQGYKKQSASQAKELSLLRVSY